MAGQVRLGFNNTKASITVFEDLDERAFMRNLLDHLIALRNAVDTLTTDYKALATLYNAHTHACDGAQAGAYNCSVPDATAATAPLVAAAASAGTTTTAAPPTVSLTAT